MKRKTWGRIFVHGDEQGCQILHDSLMEVDRHEMQTYYPPALIALFDWENAEDNKLVYLHKFDTIDAETIYEIAFREGIVVWAVEGRDGEYYLPTTENTND